MKKYLIAFSTSLIIFLSSFSQEIAVTIPGQQYNLNGTLILPSGTGTFPAIVLIHGSGPSDRDQRVVITGGNAACLYPGLYNDTIRNFKDLAQQLSAEGYAVLRYDKRTFTYSTQLNQKTITPYDFIQDVHNAVDFIKTRSEIDTNKLILLGHSQGCNFLPIIANDRNDIKAIIGLGAAAKGIDSIMAAQFRDLYYICLNDTVTGDNTYNQMISDFQKIRNGTWNPNTPYQGAYPLFWKDWIDITDSSIFNFNAVNHPSLLLHAMNDFNIPLEDAQRYESKVTRSSFDLFYMNDLTHYFTNGTVPVVHQSVPDTIIYWLRQNNLTGIANRSETASEQITVSYTKYDVLVIMPVQDSNATMNVFDLSGKLVKSGIKNENGIFRLSKSALMGDVFIVQVNSSSHSWTVKLFLTY